MYPLHNLYFYYYYNFNVINTDIYQRKENIMIVLVSQSKKRIIMLQSLQAIVETTEHVSESSNQRYLKVVTNNKEFEICSAEDSNEATKNKNKGMFKDLKISILKAYKDYEDDTVKNPYKDAYYYIDYEYKLQKVNTIEELF